MSYARTDPGAHRPRLHFIIQAFAAVLSAGMTIVLLFSFVSGGSTTARRFHGTVADVRIMDRFDTIVGSAVTDAAAGAQAVPKVYWLRDSETVSPEPDPSAYGTAENSDEVRQLLNRANAVLNGQDTLLSEQTHVWWRRSAVQYYLDDTIFAATWKQVMDGCVYTISEVKIADASQIRRYLSGGKYGSEKLETPSDMAAQANAVVASAGDYYGRRELGIIVYNGEVKRYHRDRLQVLGVDNNGDFIFLNGTDFDNAEAVQQYVAENHIRFTLAFGPVIVDNYERCDPSYYPVGEVDEEYCRSAICQMDALHYLIVVAGSEGGYDSYPTLRDFAKRVQAFGCEKAYTLDGGLTATLVMNDEVVGRIRSNPQRKITDIVYFATAVPNCV